MNNIKKISAVICAFSMAFGGLAVLPSDFNIAGTSISAGAEDLVSGDYKYKILDDGTVEITDYTGKDTKITIPKEIDGKAVTSIGNYAFYNCENVESIIIPNSVTSIGDEAFYNCINLKSITIPDSVINIGSGVFLFCTGLKNITVDENNKNYISSDGILFDKDKTKLICCPARTTLKDYTVPDSVTNIGEGAFHKCVSLKNVVVGKNVKSIGKAAFCYCDELESITIPDGVTTIDDVAFSNCTSLKNIIIPDSVTFIGAMICNECSSLKNVYIGKNVKSIEFYAFYDCTNISNVIIPDSVASIKAYAFFECTGITSVTIPSSVTSINNMAFGYTCNDETGKYKKIEGFKIYCYKNTAGEQYAIENDFDYRLLDNKKDDSSSIPDNSSVVDNSNVPDSSSVAESSSVPDSSSIADSSSTPDSSSAIDSSSVSDSSSVAESSSISDSSSIVDSSSISDNSSAADSSSISVDYAYSISADKLQVKAGDLVDISINTNVNNINQLEYKLNTNGLTINRINLDDDFKIAINQYGSPLYYSNTFKLKFSNADISYNGTICRYTVRIPANAKAGDSFTVGLTKAVVNGVDAEYNPVTLTVEETDINSSSTQESSSEAESSSVPENSSVADSSSISDSSSIPEETKFYTGNVDGNNIIDTADALYVLKAVVSLENLNDEQKSAADVDKNGVVDTSDALAILKFIVGLIDKF